jgi:hypothetical protein
LRAQVSVSVVLKVVEIEGKEERQKVAFIDQSESSIDLKVGEHQRSGINEFNSTTSNTTVTHRIIVNKLLML